VTSALTAEAVPFVDLDRIHADLRDELLAAVARVIESGQFTNGPEVEAFEREFAAFAGAEYCVGLASGLDALTLGLVAAGLEPGDEVIVPAATFVATAEAVVHAGGVPTFVDVSEDDYCMDISAIESAISSRTRFLLPVHLYGQMADMEIISAIAGRHGVGILEDACQAHGAERAGRRAGVAGLAGAFSFYPGKNLGAIGDAGALVTNNADLRARVVSLREHGQRGKYIHERVGFTARLDTVQAAALLHKLPYLARWNAERDLAARYYSDALREVGDLLLPPVPTGSRPVWHLYVIRTARPADLADALRAEGIGTGRHYPEPVHLTRAFARPGLSAGAFPVSEALSRQALSLPIFPGITEPELDRVVAAIRRYFGDV
jgi:dTDP-4-amino-4,6-dideoxygalactose transaminase